MKNRSRAISFRENQTHHQSVVTRVTVNGSAFGFYIAFALIALLGVVVYVASHMMVR